MLKFLFYIRQRGKIEPWVSHIVGSALKHWSKSYKEGCSSWRFLQKIIEALNSRREFTAETPKQR